jgi:hypothetical protein
VLGFTGWLKKDALWCILEAVLFSDVICCRSTLCSMEWRDVEEF